LVPQDRHLEQHHICAADASGKEGEERCLSADDEAYDGSTNFLCRECTQSLGRESIYCSAACAAADFQRHRERVHLPAWERRGMAVDDDLLIEFLDDGETYRAKDIHAHLISEADEQRKLQEAVKATRS